MVKTHREFMEELKFENKTDKKSQENKLINSDEFYKRRTSQEKEKYFKEQNRKFQEYRRRLWENKHNNWIAKRKEEGKDYSEELFERLTKYFKKEQEVFDNLLESEYKKAQRIWNSANKYIVDDEIIYEVKTNLYNWRENNEEYIELQDEIEELRYISDDPILENSENAYADRDD